MSRRDRAKTAKRPAGAEAIRAPAAGARAKRGTAANAKAATAEPEVERTVEDRRRDLVRSLAIFASDWRRCPRSLCRRRRSCMLPGVVCFSPRPSKRPPLTEEQWAREKAWLLRALQERAAGFKREGET